MKINVLERIKESKPFHFGDLFVYILSAIFLFILFAVFVIFPPTTQSDGIKITKDGKEVFTYYFSSHDYQIVNEFSDLIVVNESDEGLYVKIFFDDLKRSFNVVYIDFSSSTARVTESNCSSSKDCVHSSPVKDSGVIVCAPHKLKIAPLVEKIDQPTVG